MITILYVFDSLRFDHVGCFNDKASEITPNIDSLAKESIKCFNHIAPATWTLPSLASILTGFHPCQLGVNYITDRIPPNIKRVSQYYSDMGYKTVGISANPYFSSVFNAELGFDIFRLLLDSETFKRRDIANFATSLDLNKNLFEIVSENKKENLFVMIWGLDTHNPFYLRDKNLTKFVEKEDWDKVYTLKKIERTKEEKEFKKIGNFYKNMVYQNDCRIGEIISFLKESQLFESSTIAILSDHGETLTKENFGHCGPPFREQIQTPFILKSPRDKKSSYPQEIRHLTSMDNVLATLMKIDFSVNLKKQKSIFEDYREHIYSTRGFSQTIFFYEALTTKNSQIINTRRGSISFKREIKKIIKKILQLPTEKIVRRASFYLAGKEIVFQLKKKETEKLFAQIGNKIC